jgi:hypothetical protein
MLERPRWERGGRFVVNQLTSDTLREELYGSTGKFLRLYEGTGRAAGLIVRLRQRSNVTRGGRP